MDNKKLKKADGKRISLTQKYERDYLIKIAREQQKNLQQMEGRKVSGYSPDPFQKTCSRKKLIRICKGLIKALRRIK